MDYKRVKEENAAALRERKLTLLALLLICIIAVECIVIAVLWVSNYRYKVMYDEALETQLLMQQEINSLQEGGVASEDNQNGEDGNAEQDKNRQDAEGNGEQTENTQQEGSN